MCSDVCWQRDQRLRLAFCFARKHDIFEDSTEELKVGQDEDCEISIEYTLCDARKTDREFRRDEKLDPLQVDGDEAVAMRSRDVTRWFTGTEDWESCSRFFLNFETDTESALLHLRHVESLIRVILTIGLILWFFFSRNCVDAKFQYVLEGLEVMNIYDSYEIIRRRRNGMWISREHNGYREM